ncbi:hypothetical protein R3W88_000423 [Solanum pinnatisectum]|uniref:Uncharacterized protein n=1 Tax=Solanum pinnatisectum TaxID=50273 RepID=A0AAV9MFV5_9SOLN|nr:hypothetical protein R3W88_000423 [Solanum pinnatisectum]
MIGVVSDAIRCVFGDFTLFELRILDRVDFDQHFEFRASDGNSELGRETLEAFSSEKLVWILRTRTNTSEGEGVPAARAPVRGDEFDRFEHGSLSVSEYDARLYKLSCYAMSSTSTKFEWIHRVAVPRYFVARVSSAVIHPEVETIQVRAHRVIRVDQCRPPFKVQMVLVDLDLVKMVKVCIVDPQVKEGVQTLLVTLSVVLVPVVILFVRSLESSRWCS